jgi:AbrB family looped-hinge helix DNA binding protein
MQKGIFGKERIIRSLFTYLRLECELQGRWQEGAMCTSYVNAKGQLVIPARIRRKLGIKPGMKVCFVERGSDILFQPVTKKYIRSMSGMLKSATSVTEELLDERKKDRTLEKDRLVKCRAR